MGRNSRMVRIYHLIIDIPATNQATMSITRTCTFQQIDGTRLLFY